jgi:hypothetical protein
VLLGQGYRTPRAAVIHEYGAVVELWLAGGKLRTRKKHRYTCDSSFIPYDYNFATFSFIECVYKFAANLFLKAQFSTHFSYKRTNKKVSPS